MNQGGSWIKDCEWADNESDDEENCKNYSYSQESPNKEHECGFLCSRHGCRRNWRVEIVLL